MLNHIAELARSRGMKIANHCFEMPEGRSRAALVLVAAFLNFVRRMIRPTDHAFMEGEQHG